MAKPGRPGASKKKGGRAGTGGNGRQALEGKGPTPKAEDRPYHNSYRTQKAKAEARQAPKKGQFVASKTGKSSKANATEVLSGRNSVVEALRAKIPATALYIAQRIDYDDRVRDAISIANNRGISVNEVTRVEIDRMTGGDSVHQGIALQVPPYNYKDPNELLDRALSASTLPLIVALDGITDPHNLGACLRVADGAGVHAVIAPKDHAAGINATVAKVASGAAETMPYFMVTNLARTLGELKERSIWVIGTSDDAPRSIYQADLKIPTALVLGAEGAGMRQLTRKNCDELVSIPMQGAVESLNVSVASGVCLYEARRQRMLVKV